MTRNKGIFMSRYLVPIYTITIFLSAFLLFVFQPMVGKYILPTLGGTPSVWNTAMLFFQILLLAGYIYAHLLGRIGSIRVQAGLHLVLMALACAALPLALPENIEPIDTQPVLWQLRTMIGMAAGPFFILSASAPLLQKWFSRTHHKNADNPYFLYSASNIGSMLALLTYPVITEPLLALHEQSNLWSVGYFTLAGMFILCIWSSKFHTEIKPDKIETVEKIALKRKLLWVFLAFCPSSLMLGYTTYITTDVASMPLFWVIPLALYLGTFIIAFAAKPFLPLQATRIIQAVLLIFLAALQISTFTGHGSPWYLMIFHGALFFFTALMCHQELVALKPKTSSLTEFYLFLSLGGALGGVFNSLLAPVLFKLPYEYYIVIVLSLFARYASEPLSKTPEFNGRKSTYKELALFPGVMLLGISAIFVDSVWVRVAIVLLTLVSSMFLINRRIAFMATIALIMIFNPPNTWTKIRDSVLIERNFFGVLRIQDYPAQQIRILSNGTTTHGAQALDHNFKKIPLTYYHPAGAVGDIFAVMDGYTGEQKIAALGLGIGSIACYNRTGRSFDFYEINQQVIDITENPKYFSYLKDCGSPYKIVLGDARHKIEEAPDHSYGMIFVDVFSSDNIPIHVMTLEAIETYKKKLKPGGIIVIHVSNRYFNLQREVAALAKATNMQMLYRLTKGGNVLGTKMSYTPSIYTVMSDNPQVMAEFEKRQWTPVEIPEDMHPWTDDYANIIRAFK